MIAFYDTECFPGYWLLRIRAQDGREWSAELRAGQYFSWDAIDGIVALFDHFTMVSFNGNNYDVPMLTGAMSAFKCEQLKQLNDRIIVEQLKPWELGLPEWKPRAHIDVMETAPGHDGFERIGHSRH